MAPLLQVPSQDEEVETYIFSPVPSMKVHGVGAVYVRMAFAVAWPTADATKTQHRLSLGAVKESELILALE